MVTVKGYASEEIERNYLKGKDLSQENSGSEHHFLAVWGLWVFHLVRGPLATACDLAEQLFSLAEREHNPDMLIRAHESVGSTYSFLGRFNEAKTHLLAAKSLYDPINTAPRPYPIPRIPASPRESCWPECMDIGRGGSGRSAGAGGPADLPWRAGEWFVLRVVAVIVGGLVGYLLLLSRSPWLGLALGVVDGCRPAQRVLLRFRARRRARQVRGCPAGRPHADGDEPRERLQPPAGARRRGP